MRTSRVEAFSDGVFAIALTLLVLTIEVPNVNGNLSRELASSQKHAADHIGPGTV